MLATKGHHSALFSPLVRPGGLSCWLAICPTCMFILCCFQRQLQRASLFRRVKKTKTLFPFPFGRSVFRTRPLHLLGASSSSSCLCFPPVSRVCYISNARMATAANSSTMSLKLFTGGKNASDKDLSSPPSPTRETSTSSSKGWTLSRKKGAALSVSFWRLTSIRRPQGAAAQSRRVAALAHRGLLDQEQAGPPGRLAEPAAGPGPGRAAVATCPAHQLAHRHQWKEQYSFSPYLWLISPTDRPPGS